MNEERRKASACLQPATKAKCVGSLGMSNLWSCNSSSRCDMSRIPAEATVEEGAWGRLPNCESIIHQLHTLGEVEAWPWMILGDVG